MQGICEISVLHKCKRHNNWRHHQGSHSGDQELVQKRTITLVLLCARGEDLVFFSKPHHGHQTQYKKRQRKERHEGGSPRTTGGGGCVNQVLEAAWHLALGGLVKVDGYLHQEEDQVRL
jgi:hypothetical protein